MPMTPAQRDALVKLIQERKRKQEDAPGALDYVIPAALRIGGGVGGALIGGGTTLGLGTLAGGGIGSALGETAAQAYETSRGMREGISPTGIAIEGALGAVPLGKAVGAARAAKQGALLAGGGYAAHKVLEEGEVPGLETVPIAGLGALLGGGAHKLFGAAKGAVPSRIATAEQQAVPTPTVTDEARRLAELGVADTKPSTMADIPDWGVSARVGSEVEREPLRQGFPDILGGPRAPEMDPTSYRMLAETGSAAEPVTMRGGFPEEIVGRQREVPTPADFSYTRLGQPDDTAFPDQIVPLGTPRMPPPDRLLTEGGPIPLGPGPRIPSPSLATDVPASGRSDLSGLLGVEADQLAARQAGTEMDALRAAQEAPRAQRWGTPDVTPSPAANVAPEAAGAAARPTQGAEGELLAFLKGKGRGATLEQLKKKFGPAIEPIVERLARSGALSWGGKEGAERFSLPRSGESGFIGGELGQLLGGGLLGGAVGATQGETPEERMTYALLGAGAGAAGGATLGRLLERRRLGPNPSKVAEAILGPAPATESVGPAVAKVKTDRTIPVIGGTRLTKAQGDVPVVQEAIPEGGRLPLPPTGKQPKARFEEAGINLEKYSPELRPFIQEQVITDTQKALVEQQRRGRLPVAWARARAQDMVSRVDEPLKAGTTVKPEEAYALALHEGAAFQEAHDAWRQSLETGSVEDKAKALDWLLKAQTLSLSRVGASAEAARLLRYQQELRRGMTVGQRLMSDALRQGRLTKVLGDFDQLMAQVPADPTEAAKFLSQHMDAGAFDKLTSYFMANILSAPPAFIRNAIGSAVNSVGRVAIKAALAAPADIARAKLTGGQRSLYSTEVLHELGGLSFALKEGLDDAFSTFRNGFSTRAIKEGLEFGELNLPKVEFAGGAANPWNLPGRILESTDRFFQTFNQAISQKGLVWARAQREADAKGLTGQAFDEFMQTRIGQLMQDDFMRGQAVEVGRYTAFREDPGKIANALIGMKKQAPLLNYVIPFVKTVSNIFRQGIEHSPLAPMLSRTRQQMFPNMAGLTEAEQWMAQRGQAEAFGKWAFGLASMVPIGVYAATGKLSGSGPADPAKRAALYEQGWRPNSIQIGDKWYNYSTWQPISVPMALIANAFESYEDSVDAFTKEGKDVDWEKVASSTAFKVLNSATQQSYMQGVMALSAAMEDPDQFAENFLRQMAQGFYPLSGAQRTLTRAMDPTIREQKTVQESLQRITPGLSEKLPSRLNRWGEDVTYSGSPLWRAIGGPVLGGEGRKPDPVNDELMRLKIDVGLPSERIVMGGKRVELQRGQGHELRQLKGQLVRRELERVILAPGYNNLPDPLKRERIEDALAKISRSNAKGVRLGMQRNPSDFLSLLRERANRGQS